LKRYFLAEYRIANRIEKTGERGATQPQTCPSHNMEWSLVTPPLDSHILDSVANTITGK
jgi:hypothetical protein